MAIGYNEAQKAERARTEQFWKEAIAKLKQNLVEAEREYKKNGESFYYYQFVKIAEKALQQGYKDKEFQLGR